MKRVIIMLAVILAGSGLCSTLLSTATHAEEPIAIAKPKSGGCNASLFGMPAWYNGLSGGSGCEFTPIKNGEEVDICTSCIPSVIHGSGMVVKSNEEIKAEI